jgi:cytochrome c biogenesis protein CcmG, thiol:disulfide interchange protein DsbE
VPRRPILYALALAVVTTLAVVVLVQATRPTQGDGTASGSGANGRAVVGQPVPAVTGTTLDGQPFDLASLAGRPVLINFWGPSCVPCRDEFPLMKAKLAEHGGDALAIVGVLTDDPVEPARSFVTQYGATWPTVVDPDKAFKTAYRVAGRPQTYFVDRNGVLRSIQIGQMQDADFERQYAQIAK